MSYLQDAPCRSAFSEKILRSIAFWLMLDGASLWHTNFWRSRVCSFSRLDVRRFRRSSKKLDLLSAPSRWRRFLSTWPSSKDFIVRRAWTWTSSSSAERSACRPLSAAPWTILRRRDQWSLRAYAAWEEDFFWYFQRDRSAIWYPGRRSVRSHSSRVRRLASHPEAVQWISSRN